MLISQKRERERARARESEEREEREEGEGFSLSLSFLNREEMITLFSNGRLHIVRPRHEHRVDREDGGLSGVDVCWLLEEREKEEREKREKREKRA